LIILQKKDTLLEDQSQEIEEDLLEDLDVVIPDIVLIVGIEKGLPVEIEKDLPVGIENGLLEAEKDHKAELDLQVEKEDHLAEIVVRRGLVVEREVEHVPQVKKDRLV